MLGFAANLEICLETPAPLGAHDSRLPAGAVFFQGPEQSDALAAALAPARAGEMFAHNFCRRSMRANCHRAGFAVAADAVAGAHSVSLARARQRLVANRNLALCVRGEYD